MSPTKHTILDELERGAPMRLAAAAAGLDVAEVRDMLRADVLFAARVRKAVAKGARASLDKVLESDDWRAHAWFLERTHPEDFGQRQTVSVEAVSPDEARKELARLIRPAWLSTPEARSGTPETAAEGARDDDGTEL